MGHGGAGEVPQSSANVLPGRAGGHRSLRHNQSGHIRAREELGEGAAAAGVAVHRDRAGGQQERPGRQAHGRVRRGAGLRRRERPAVHGDQRQDRHERQRHLPSHREQVTKERERRRRRRRGRRAPARGRRAARLLLLQVIREGDIATRCGRARRLRCRGLLVTRGLYTSRLLRFSVPPNPPVAFTPTPSPPVLRHPVYRFIHSSPPPPVSPPIIFLLVCRPRDF